MPEHKKVECHECGSIKDIRAMYAQDVFDTPWDKMPYTIYTCKNMPQAMKKAYKYNWHESCEELLTDTSWADFRYFTCEHCQRMICEQNPRNGWHVQYRIVNDCEQICLQCYESMMFENGLEREELEQGKLPGMFFDESELSEHGFTKVIDYAYIRSSNDAKRVCEQAIALIDSGKKVVINYESMAIGGLEGYVSLYSADKTE